MKYKQRTTYTGDIIETILNGRGIENIDLFLNPTNEDNTRLELVKNIEKGIELIKENINKKILILVDSDCDGMTSSSIMYQYLKFVNPDADLDFYVHRNKAHGLTDSFMEYIKGKGFDLIIVPDAGSNDIESIEKVECEEKAKVLVIDHHEIEKKSKFGVIINNQACENTNSNLTGAGMVYIFCKALEQTYNTGRLEELSDLALLGLVGDGASLKENEVRFLCMNAIKNLNNNLIRTFYNVNNKELDSLVVKDLSFGGIIPFINAVVRVGTLEEKIQLFEALTNINCNFTTVVEKKKLNKETRKYEMKSFEMNAYEYMVEVGSKAKGRQDSIAKKAMKLVSEQYDPNAGIQLFILKDEDSKGITGLIANKLSNQYQQPCIVMWEDEHENYIGSLRGNIKILNNFKQWCIDTRLFELAQGHANAAGIILKKSNYLALKEKTKHVQPEEYCHEVDVIYTDYVNADDIRTVDRYKHLFYGGVDEPLFAVENTEVPKSSLIQMKNTMKFYKNGVTYLKFRTTEEEFNSIKNRGLDDNVMINIVGRFDVNKWNEREFPQFIIEDYEIIEKIENEANLIYGIFA